MKIYRTPDFECRRLLTADVLTTSADLFNLDDDLVLQWDELK